MMSLLVVLGSVSASPPPPTTAPQQPDEVPYVVQRGDTLDSIRHRYLLPERDWQSLLKPAQIRNERRLPIGRRIDIPRSWLRFTLEPARLASYRGQVQLSRNGAAMPIQIGGAVEEGATFATGPNSFITLVLGDQSTVVIPSQSRGTVRRMRRILLSRSIDYRIDIEEGRLETKVTPVEGSDGRYRIMTPVSTTAVRGTEFRVSYDPLGKRAATELLTGAVSFSAPSGEDLIALDARFGASRASTGMPQIEPLLPAPELADAGRVQTEERVHFQARPVEGAARYRSVIATDAGFIDNITEQFSDSGAFSFEGIPNGNAFVRVSALTATGMEGFSQAYGFTRKALSIEATASSYNDGYRFRWHSSGGQAPRYRFQLMPASPETVPILDQVALTREEITLRGLRPGIYYWRVGVTEIENGQAASAWSQTTKLTVGANGGHRSERR